MASASDAEAPRSGRPSLHGGSSSSSIFAEKSHKAPFDDLYDVSDQEEVKARNLIYIAKNKGKQKQKSEVASTSSRDNTKRNERFPDNSRLSSSSDAEGEIREQQRITNQCAKSRKPAINSTRDNSTNLDSVSSRSRERRRSNKSISAQKPLPYASPKHDKSDYYDFSADEIDASTPLNSEKVNKEITSISSSAKKRKRSEMQIPLSSPIVSLSDPLCTSDPCETIPSSKPRIDRESREKSVSNARLGRTGNNSTNDPSTPSNRIELLAPPISSSSLDASPFVTAKNLRSLRARTPQMESGYHSDISSPPSLTHSPDLPSEIELSPELIASLPSHYSTAQLQALLPRRRKNRARVTGVSIESDHEVDAPSLASDDDELMYFPKNTRAHGQRQTRKVSKKISAGPKNANVTERKKYGSSKKKSQREEQDSYERENETYLEQGPGSLSNDENTSENSQELEKRVGKELKMATRKFQEIDKWQLDFEEVTVSGSSSPKDVR